MIPALAAAPIYEAVVPEVTSEKRRAFASSPSSPSPFAINTANSARVMLLSGSNKPPERGSAINLPDNSKIASLAQCLLTSEK
ncbi:hypothetical protein D3C81_1196530 [compost metagenome]